MPHSYQKWSEYEDHILAQLIQQLGDSDWPAISENMFRLHRIRRSARQCRARWHDWQSRGDSCWRKEEDVKIIQLQAIYGSRWVRIAEQIKNRTDGQIKNRFFSLVRKGLRSICKLLGHRTSDTSVYSLKPTTLAQILQTNSTPPTQNRTGRKSGKLPVLLQEKQLAELRSIILPHIIGDDRFSEALLSQEDKRKLQWLLHRLEELNQAYENKLKTGDRAQNVKIQEEWTNERKREGRGEAQVGAMKQEEVGERRQVQEKQEVVFGDIFNFQDREIQPNEPITLQMIASTHFLANFTPTSIPIHLPQISSQLDQGPFEDSLFDGSESGWLQLGAFYDFGSNLQ